MLKSDTEGTIQKIVEECVHEARNKPGAEDTIYYINQLVEDAIIDLVGKAPNIYIVNHPIDYWVYIITIVMCDPLDNNNILNFEVRAGY